MEVLVELLIPRTCEYNGDEGVMQEWLSRPVVLILWKVLDPHGDVDTDVGLDLIGSCRMPVHMDQWFQTGHGVQSTGQ